MLTCKNGCERPVAKGLDVCAPCASRSSCEGLRRRAAYWLEMSGYGEVLHDGSDAFETAYGQDEDSLAELLARVRREGRLEGIEECAVICDQAHEEGCCGHAFTIIDALRRDMRALQSSSSEPRR